MERISSFPSEMIALPKRSLEQLHSKETGIFSKICNLSSPPASLARIDSGVSPA